MKWREVKGGEETTYKTTTSTGWGYTCPNCGQWVGYGQIHCCADIWPPNPIPTQHTVFICPVCNGAGKIPEDYEDTYRRGSSKNKIPCHGCHGEGWVQT